MAYQGIAPVIFESVSHVTATNSVELGTEVTVDGRRYRYVYNAGNSQISVGRGATVSGTSGYSVTVSSTTMLDVFVGACYHATIPTGYYGWLLTKGAGKVAAPASTGLASGDILFPGGDGCFSPNAPGGTSTTQGLCHGKVTVSTASAGVGEAYVSTLYG
jgi:hypothetical protein